MNYNEFKEEKAKLNKEYNAKFDALKNEHQQKLAILKRMWSAITLSSKR